MAGRRAGAHRHLLALLAMFAVAVAAVVPAGAATAQAPAPALAGLSFLVGAWTAGRGEVAETGGSSAGRSTVTVEAGGAVLLRRDHTDLLMPPASRRAGSTRS